MDAGTLRSNRQPPRLTVLNAKTGGIARGHAIEPEWERPHDVWWLDAPRRILPRNASYQMAPTGSIVFFRRDHSENPGHFLEKPLSISGQGSVKCPGKESTRADHRLITLMPCPLHALDLKPCVGWCRRPPKTDRDGVNVPSAGQYGPATSRHHACPNDREQKARSAHIRSGIHLRRDLKRFSVHTLPCRLRTNCFEPRIQQQRRR